MNNVKNERKKDWKEWKLCKSTGNNNNSMEDIKIWLTVIQNCICEF